MTANRKKQGKITISGAITLGDLRWLVNECNDLQIHDSVRVVVREEIPFNQPASISVEG